MQSVAGSASPADASKGEITDIKEELTKLLADEANDDMSYEGQAYAMGLCHAVLTAICLLLSLLQP